MHPSFLHPSMEFTLQRVEATQESAVPEAHIFR
jgi:hypothetical protein